MIDRRRLLTLAATFAVAPAVARAALAEDWPSRPVRVIVPYPAGGSTDVVTRITADWLTRAWGQQMVVENKPGASSNLAAAFVVPVGGCSARQPVFSLERSLRCGFTLRGIRSAGRCCQAKHDGTG